MESIEKTIRKNLCGYCCCNSKEKCMEILEIQKQGLTVYKCLNYKKGEIDHSLSRDLEEEFKEMIIRRLFGNKKK